MPDSIPTLDSSPPAPAPDFSRGDWSPAKAGKMILWAIGYWKTAESAGVAMAPAATAVVDKISEMTSTIGITLQINQPVFESMLPVIIFAGIFTGHDFLRYKLADNPIVKKLM